MTRFLDIFFGTPQSKFAAYAIFAAIIAISISILFTSTDVSIGQRFGVILFIILLSIPSILLTLFELTCIITGGTKKVNWWCWYFGWLIAAFLGIYSVVVIITIFISMFSYNNAMDRVKNTEHTVTKEEADDYAKTIILSDQADNDEQETTEQHEQHEHHEHHEDHEHHEQPKKSPQQPVIQSFTNNEEDFGVMTTEQDSIIQPFTNNDEKFQVMGQSSVPEPIDNYNYSPF